jgi:predicted dehydrogenase
MIRGQPISENRPLRVGLLGAARIAPSAIIRPARQRRDVQVTCVAARDPARAREFAAEHGIRRVADSYRELVADPEIDVVYNPLPNAWHGPWTLRALQCSKHVLCEKPLASQTSEARAMVDAARDAQLLLMEALHYAYHPLTQRWLDLLRRGTVGELVRVSARFETALPPTDIRFDLGLAGGATMDLGCYCIHAIRLAVGEEPNVVGAQATQGPEGIDGQMVAELSFPSGVRAGIECSMKRDHGFAASLRVEGSRGTMQVDSFPLPHLGHRLQLSAAGASLDETVAGGTTYDYQLRALVEALRSGSEPPTSGEDSLANMRVIDAVYSAAGLPLRPIKPPLA